MKESLSKIVYHNTYIDRCYDILKSNTFKLTSQLGTGSDQFSDKFYYLSVSRIKFGGYAHTFSKDNNVCMVLDGDKFNQRYKGGPVDYWGQDYKKAGRDSGNIGTAMRQDENEERVFTDDDNIPNAKKYILAIHISINDAPDNEDNSDYYAFLNHANYRELQAMKTMASNGNIPFYVYVDNFSAFKVLDTRKAADLAERKNNINVLVNAFEVDRLEDLPYEFPYKSFIDDMKYYKDYNSTKEYVPDRDLLAQVKNDIHNYRTREEYRGIIVKLSKYMKQAGTRSIEEFLAYLARKFSK
jgi:hypothetical protein